MGPIFSLMPQLRDHQARELGRALDVVLSAGRDVAEHELLGHAPAEQRRAGRGRIFLRAEAVARPSRAATS